MNLGLLKGSRLNSADEGHSLSWIFCSQFFWEKKAHWRLQKHKVHTLSHTHTHLKTHSRSVLLRPALFDYVRVVLARRLSDLFSDIPGKQMCFGREQYSTQ